MATMVSFGSPRGVEFPLTQDILYTVLENLGTLPSNYAPAALVARKWTAPAQAGLYKCTIRISVVDTEYGPIIRTRSLLSRTMTTSPHLRCLLRSLRVIADDPYRTEDSYLDWLRLVPPHTLRSFEYRCNEPGAFCPALLEAPAVQTVPFLIIHTGPRSMDDLKAVLVPGLESLVLTVDESFDGDIDWPLPPKLRTLTVSNYRRWCPALYRLFIALSPQLNTFSTDGPWFVAGDFHTWMESTLARHGRNLKGLYLTGENVGTAVSGFVGPFLDKLVSHSTRLENLRVVAGAYTDRLFRTLPPSVKVLEFFGDQLPIPFEDALLDSIARAGKKEIALSRIVVYSYEFLGVGKPEVYTGLAEACSKSGVQFEYVGYDPW
ncbi:hypothetical protein OH76DRAFT_1559796 [Lentinus brumalis]|uniref:F-box domain-containing protein n=1 Tax=Lentinus brumalis TaxID=2498619 RepID=A0A371CVH5_9APHY|nr:hypothetical protein OH76DRAFT_1559796 [Polyporus brumalis]